VFNKKITYIGNEPVENGKKFAFTVKIEEGSKTYFSKPVMYVSEYNNSLMREPDILIGAARDIYLSPLSFQEGEESGGKEIDLKKGEPYKIGNSEILFEKFDIPPDAMQKMMNKEEFDINAVLKITTGGITKNLNIVVNDSLRNSFQIEEDGLTFTVAHFDVSGVLELNVMDSNNKKEINADILSIEYREKPLINLVWSGVLLMAIGFLIMLIRRFRELKD
jgi:cytochrome c-type biogenesis protein CcmF